MGEQKNLSSQEGIAKLQELAKAADVCMFVTNLQSTPMSARPMSTRDVDDEGNIWFFSRVTSNKNDEIKDDSRVQLFYSNNGSSEYLSIAGTATILKDHAMAKELWSGWAKTWFNEGPEDPELSILKVAPDDVQYWDTKDGRMISLLKIAVGALTGREFDGGVEGKISV